MADGKITIGTKIDQKGAKKGLKDLQSKLKGSGRKAQKIGGQMTKYLTAPFIAMGAMAIKSAKDFDDANRTIQQGLGVTNEEAEKLTETANNIYKDGFGQSLDDVSKALIDVKNNFGDLVDEADLERVTKDAVALSKTLEADVNETARAGTALMKEFGEDSEGAFDALAWGAQNGLNFSDELLDNVAEYAPLFADMGYSTEEYFSMLKEGTEEGSYNLDYLNDVMKEFNVRLSDGTAGEAIETMSKSTQDMFNEWKNGEATASEVMTAVTEEMATMDQRAIDAIGPEIFGTKFEDLGADAVLAMGNVDGSIKDVDGTMKGITESQEEAFGQRFQSLLRESLDSLRPVGEVILDLAQNALPPLINNIKMVAEWFASLSPITQKIIVFITALIAILPPLIMLMGTLAIAVTAVTWPMLAIVAAVVAVIAIVGVLTFYIIKHWDTIKTFTIIVFKAIGAFFKWLWGWIKKIFTSSVDAVTGALGIAWNWVKNTTESVFNGIASFFSGLWDGITAGVEKFKDIFLGVWDAIKDGVKAVINPIIGFINMLIGALEGMVNAISGAVNKIPSFDVPDWVPGIGGSTFGLPKIPSVSLPKIPSLDVGTNFVAQDGLAMLHQGEAVVPKEYNPALGGGGGDYAITVEIPLDGEVIAKKTVNFTARELETMRKSSSRGRGGK